jgi:glycosyltransferase involved in cell wall biosynthesis
VFWNSEATQHLADRGIRLYLAPFGVTSIDFWLTASKNIVLKRLRRECFISPSSSYYARPQLQRLWRQQLESGPWAAVLVNHALWHRLVRQARKRGIITIIDMHDLLADAYVALWQLNYGVHPPEEKVRKMFADELRCLDSAEIVLAINPVEGALVRPHLKAFVEDMPFCISEPAQARRDNAAADILVVGSSMEQNKRGLRQFMQGAWPKIRAARPDVRLTICGRVGEDLPPQPNVAIHLLVPDLSPYYRSTQIALLTSVAGPGIKIKTVEALAHGCCIIAHENSISGIPFRPGIHGEVMRDLAEAAPNVLKLLTSPELRFGYQAKALRLFREQFDIKIGQERLSTIMLRHCRESADSFDDRGN